MKEPIVTVLVAAYNAEKYIAKCLDSLMRQTLQDIEVIVIDDFSQDRTPLIVQQYAINYPAISGLLLAKNGGQAHARNVGLKMARGKYVCFLDADDWFSDDALQSAVDVFNHNPLTDSVLFHVVNYFDEQHQEPYPMQDFQRMTGREAFKDSLSWKIHGVYMVRREIHVKFPYDETCRAYSDDNTTRLHYLASREVRLCDGTYYYRQHKDSVTHQVSLLHFDWLRANESMKKQLQALDMDDEVLNQFENQRWLVVVDCYQFYFRHRQSFTQQERQEALRAIKTSFLNIEPRRLYPRNHYKLGYCPMHANWPLFRLEEEIYFTLKHFLR